MTPIFKNMDLVAERAVRGDREAMAELVNRHYAEVFRFCAKFLKIDEAEDATQETFTVASTRIRKFRGESHVRTWLFGIALNRCRAIIRKKTNSMPLEAWQHTKDIQEGLIAAEAIRNAMNKLDLSHREVVILHEIEGRTYTECADVIGIPEGTVKSRLFHAFQKLREYLLTGETNR
jgi:RNA polymerase sigma-70 factor (ECF subfamily)